MRTIIADDESLARKKLGLLLRMEPGVEIAAECSNGQQTLTALRDYKPDLLLLDIEMPDMNGFEVLSKVSLDETPIVIFTTAYDRYAVRAFEAHALDYLLKPFDRERFHNAVGRARAEFVKTVDSKAATRILSSLLKNSPDVGISNKLVFKSSGRIVFLSVNDIDWISAAANYVNLNVGATHYLLREGIGEVCEKLDASRFVRIHRSTIVNVGKIRELQPVNSGEYIVILADGKQLSCGRAYRAGLQRLIDEGHQL